ncbi:MAG: hypothetical protein HC804_03240 [Anaerolineae bacterium]|nr:hypothetical protein [Anaerolineae bacterium]
MLLIFLFTLPTLAKAALPLPWNYKGIWVGCTQSPGGISFTEVKWGDFPVIRTGTAKNDLFKWQNNSWVLADYDFGQTQGYSGHTKVFSVAFGTAWWTSSGWAALDGESPYYLNTGNTYCS